jgi:putative ABC transport system permease protein
VGHEQKVVLSHQLWQQIYGGDATVIGRELRLSGRPFTVIGIMPRDFLFIDPEVRFWTPLAFTPQQKSDDERHSNGWTNIGRLKPNATIEEAQTQVNAVNAANLERFPGLKQVLIDAGFHTTVDVLQDVLVRDVKGTLYLLWAGAAFVLLIGVVNIVNLAVARANFRIKEMATRLALGASRMHLAQQLTAEGVLLGCAAGVGGIAIASWSVRGFVFLGLDQIPRGNEIRIDFTVIGLCFVTSIIVGLVAALVPIAQLFRLNLAGMLHF